MKKYISLMLSAAILTTTVSVAFADETVVETADTAEIIIDTTADEIAEAAENVETEFVVDEEARQEARDIAAEKAEEEVYLELAEVPNSITMETAESGVETQRIVKVKYDKTRFEDGVKSFTVNIKFPSLAVTNVTTTSALGTVNGSYDDINYSYTCTFSNSSPVIAADGTLFTMTIDFANNLATSYTLTLMAGTQIEGSVVADSVDNGSMNRTSVTLSPSTNPSNKLACGNTGTTDAGFGWKFDGNDTLTISGHGNMDSYTEGAAPWYGETIIKHIIITDDGEPVTSIGRYIFAGLANLESFSLPDNVITINEGAFKDCTKLQNITFKNSVRTIGAHAFENCKGFTQISVPATVTAINEGAFAGCSNVTTARLPFVGNQKGITDVDTSKFSYVFGGSVPSSLKTVQILDETDVVASAFADCKSIETISLNEGVLTIGVSAFENCTSLKSFYVPTTVEAINASTFKGCTAATAIVLHDRIKSIGASAFENCKSLIEIDATAENIIPVATSVLSDNTFKNCSSLKLLVIGSNITSIGSAVLEGCTSLITLTIPFIGATGNVTKFNDWAFNQSFVYLFTSSLADKENTNTTVPASVTKITVLNADDQSIPPYAFYKCTYLKDITVLKANRIYNDAFENCIYLQTLYLPRGVQEIQSSILAGARNLVTLTTPFIGSQNNNNEKDYSVLGYFFGWSNTQSYDDDVYQEYNSAGERHYYHIPKSLKNIVVLAQTTIPYGAFSYCSSLENIAVTASSGMNSYAFYSCKNLKSIKLPNDLQTIAPYSFAECYTLKTINIPAKVRKIETQAFYDDEELTEVIIPDSVTIIDDDTFNGAGTAVHSEMSIAESSGVIIKGTADNTVAKNCAEKNGFTYITISEEEANASTIGLTVNPKSDDNLTKITVTADEAGTAYIAAYDSKGVLTAVKSITKAEKDMASADFTEAELSGAVKIKAFVWDGMNNLTNFAETTL